MLFYEKLLRDTLDADNGPSMRELGKAIGIPVSTLADWLSLDQKPHLKSLIRVAEWADLPLSMMLIDIEAPNNLTERILFNTLHLSKEQQQQILSQIETMLDTAP